MIQKIKHQKQNLESQAFTLNESKKFHKIEESLNIYDRLNKLELKIDNMLNKKRGQINIELIDIIKIGIAIILIIIFIQAIRSLL